LSFGRPQSNLQVERHDLSPLDVGQSHKQSPEKIAAAKSIEEVEIDDTLIDVAIINTRCLILIFICGC
jgi:hypothetical protein